MAYTPRIIQQGNIESTTYQQIRGNIDDIFTVLNKVGQDVAVTDAQSITGQKTAQTALTPIASEISGLTVNHVTKAISDTTIGDSTIVDDGSTVTLTTLAKEQQIRVDDAGTIVQDAQSTRTGFENENTDTTISFVNGTRTFTVAPTGTSFSIWRSGLQYTKTSTSLVISNVEGSHYIYFDASLTMVELVNPTPSQIETLWLQQVTCGYVYWDATNAVALFLSEEQHGITTLSGETHSYLHRHLHTQWDDGLALNTLSVDGSGAANASAQFGIDSGDISDEDLDFSVPGVAAATGLPVFWNSGASPALRRTINAGYSVLTTGSGRLAYNNPNAGGAGIWGQTEVPNGNYVLYHTFATSSSLNRTFSVMGQAQYNTLALARTGANVESASLNTVFPASEYKLLSTEIFECSNAYGNAVKARIRSTDAGAPYIDWRRENTSPSSPILASGITGLTLTVNRLQKAATSSSITDSVVEEVAGSLGVGVPAGNATLDILYNDGSYAIPAELFRITGLAHGVTNYAPTNAFGLINVALPGSASPDGGLMVRGVGTVVSGLRLEGIVQTSTSSYVIALMGSKANGVNIQALGASDLLLTIGTFGAENLLHMTGDGSFYLSTLAAAGVVHSAGSGLLSTSKIVDGDITTGTITLARLANEANATILGRGTAGAGAPEALTLSTDYGLTYTYSAGGLKINTPQDLRTTASPTFANVSANSASATIGARGTLNTSSGIVAAVNDVPHGINLVSYGSTYVGSGFGITTADTQALWSDTAMVIYVNSNNPIIFGTNNLARMKIDGAGQVYIFGLTANSIAHLGAAGQITGSLIVNADVDGSAAISYTKLNLSPLSINASGIYIGANASTASQPLFFTVSQNNNWYAFMKNTNTAGTSGAAGHYASAGSSSSGGIFAQNDSYATDGLLNANSFVLYSAGATAGLRVFTYDNYPLILGANKTEIMRLTAGKVGINGTAPDTKLAVVVASSADGIEVVNANGGSRYRTVMTVDTSYGYIDSFHIGTGAIPLQINPNGGKVGIAGAPEEQFTITTGNAYGLLHTNGTTKIGTYVDGTAGDIGTKSNHPLGFFTNNGGVQVILLTSGKFGIGKVPTATLDVADIGNWVTADFYGHASQWDVQIHGSSTTGQSYGLDIQAGTNASDYNSIFRNYGAGTVYMALRGDGHVGIGNILDPTQLLHLYQTDNPSIRFQSSGKNGYVSLATTGNAFINGSANGDMTIRADAGNILFSTDGGSTAAFTITTTADAYSIATTEYAASSTIAGFSSFGATKTITYKKIGKTVICRFALKGTGNTSNVTFTLPIAASATTNTGVCNIQDYYGSVFAMGYCSISSSTVSIYYATGSAVGMGADSRDIVQGELIYEAS